MSDLSDKKMPILGVSAPSGMNVVVPKDVTPHISENKPNSAFPDPIQLEDTLIGSSGNQPTAEVYTDGTGTSAPDKASFVYLDVGMWGGDGPSSDTSSTKWPAARDFGLIHGPIVMLCTYEKQTKAKLADDEKKKVGDVGALKGLTGDAATYGANIRTLLTEL